MQFPYQVVIPPPREHRLYCCSVEGLLQHCGDVEFPHPSEVVQALSCLLHQGGDVGGCQVHNDVGGVSGFTVMSVKGVEQKKALDPGAE